MRLCLLFLLAGCSSSGIPSNDLAAADLGPPPNLSEPVWLGSGGSAKSATQQLNMQISRGGTTAAPSGARFSSSYFSSQTN